jgi:hypothetical protein
MAPAPSPQARFWRWFRSNGARLRAMMYDGEDARDAATAEMRDAVAEVEPGLILEFGPGTDEAHDLIISADGRRERVDPIKDLVAAAPAIPGWEVIAFRPRMTLDDLAINVHGEQIGTDDVWFRVEEDADGLALTLYVRGLTPKNERFRGLGASLLAEHAVGERDALTLLSGLRVETLPADPRRAGLRPFGELVAVFDETRERKYPPPGALVLPPESEWQMLSGTIGGSPASILLNAGLAAYAGHPAYDRRLEVSIAFNEVNEDGMPTTEEDFAGASELGDRLAEGLEEGQLALLAFTLTTQGRRNLVFYTADAEAAQERLEGLLAGVDSHQVEASVERDTFWGAYRNFTQAGEEEEEE